MSAMWSERHRPKMLSECVLEHLDDHSRKLLQEAVTASQLPNVLLYGPPGTGKSTIARILCDENRFTVNRFNGSLFEKSDAEQLQKMVASRSLFHDHRCILIDEIDGATLKAQKALRALIENDSDCAWICTANEPRKIIPPLLSRMMLIDCSYATLQRREAHFAGIMRRCREILVAETVEITEAELRHVVELNYPDVRQTINALQLRSSNRMAA